MFHPDIRDNFLEGVGATLEDIVLVLDEAHNLSDLAINLGSRSAFYLFNNKCN